ncbi:MULTISPECIES: phosphoadenosine phosphosulfate reductase family protein [unclassified Clostridium]|uniref:phosphoadenosine phosphosulfate reductase domain-containing protein n=1 Tax=unclassified Clostridium TaxID=2614128 RepID=UPI0025BA91F1|nr:MULTISPECIES: phosphoadenosine phosphosulfate reductase family protein [unclassified Clostridium]
MKPIFIEEKLFLEESLGIKLPDNCWRDGNRIYLNCDSISIVTFTVKNNKILLKNNKIIDIKNNIVTIQIRKNKTQDIVNLTWEEEYEKHKVFIENLEKESIEKTIECIEKFPNYEKRRSDSGGKDSLLTNVIVDKAETKLKLDPLDDMVDTFNSSNEAPQTYKQIKKNNVNKKHQFINPKIGWYKWLKDVKKHYIPTVLSRTCCDQFKHGKLKTILDKNKGYIIFLGMRKYESKKRADYDWYLNEVYEQSRGQKAAVPKNWVRFLPAVEWHDEFVWLYILHNKLDFNPLYNLGYERVGCLICPNQSDYTDILTQHYFPLLWKRWMDAVRQNYIVKNVENRLKWTLEEYQNGKWKQGVSKEYEIMQLKATPERVQQLADIKGVSYKIAAKYFNKICACGKKLNPDEVALFLKLNGRFENTEDSRQYLCKKCTCEKEGWTSKEYQQQVMKFRNDGCNLF